MIDSKKLKDWSKQIYNIASAHGWHDEDKSDELWMSLIMSEVAELIEADRKNKTAPADVENSYSEEQLKDDTGFFFFYDAEIKGTVEEEFADIVIRLLDYGHTKWGDHIDYIEYPYEHVYRNRDNWAIPEHAWHFCKEVLNTGHLNIIDSIFYIIDWAKFINIDLEKHVDWKIRYNSLRPYKHGGKKY